MKLISIGSNCIDLYLIDGKSIPKVGGGPINVAVYMKDFNMDASYLGAIGNDEYGLLIKETLDNKNIDISHLNILDGKTAISSIELINNERIFIDYDEGVLKEFKLNNNDKEFILKHDILFCDYWSNQEEYLKEFKNKIKIVYDLADKNPMEFKYINDIDYLFFSNPNITKEELKEIYNDNLSLVVCTMGSKGSICFDGKNYYEYGIIENNNIIDTLGAGDSYIAGFIYGLLNNKDILECMYLGSKKASETLSIFGAFE